MNKFAQSLLAGAAAVGVLLPIGVLSTPASAGQLTRGIYDLRYTEADFGYRDISWKVLPAGSTDHLDIGAGSWMEYRLQATNGDSRVVSMPGNSQSATWTGTWTNRTAGQNAAATFRERALVAVDSDTGSQTHTVRVKASKGTDFTLDYETGFGAPTAHATLRISGSTGTGEGGSDAGGGSNPDPGSGSGSGWIERSCTTGKFKGTARVSTADTTDSFRLHQYKIERLNGQDGGNKANVDMGSDSYYRDTNKAYDVGGWVKSSDSMRQDSTWHDLSAADGAAGIPGRTYHEGLVRFTFDKKGNDPSCRVSVIY